MQNVHFSPPELSRLFEVNPSTIKRWIDKGMLASERTPGGHRRVSRQQLQRFITQYPKLAKRSYVLSRFKKSAGIEGTEWQRYYALLSDNQPEKARSVIEQEFIAGTKPIEILEQLIVPALREIGAAWVRNEISIYEEHRMSFYIRQHVLMVDQLLPEPPSTAPTALVACAPGEHHELLLQLLAIALKLNGYRAQVLGINVPLYELLRAVEREKPRLICISKTYPRPDGRRFLDELVKGCTKLKTKVYYGGSGWTTASPRSKAVFSASLSQFATQLQRLPGTTRLK